MCGYSFGRMGAATARLRNFTLAPSLQRPMKTIIVKGGIVLATLLTLGTLQSCFKMQEARDEPAEIQPPDPELPAQQTGDGRYLEGQEYPWSRLLDDCMAAGGARTECFASLPPEILQQIEVRPVGPTTGD